MPKNILIFADGTGQEGGVAHDTNIYKLYNMVEDRTARQIAFYDRGVGVDRGGLSILAGQIGGRGFGRNVMECYRFIFDHFEGGDRIFLFGFSRGAAAVRSLSSFIHLFGVLPKGRPELIEKAWAVYSSPRTDARDAAAEAFVKRHHTMWTKVQFLGCYDTVSALGLPFAPASALLNWIPSLRHRFHNYHLAPSVVHARHALALDDERKVFHPVLWEPLEVTRAQVTEGKFACESMRQVWFAGVHTDVGGGYAEPQMSDIPLVWITQEAVRCGLHIWPDHGVTIDEDVNGPMHDSREGWRRFFRKQARSWDPARKDRPVIHESVLSRTFNRRNASDPAYLAWLSELKPDVEPWIRYGDQPWHPRNLREDAKPERREPRPREIAAGGLPEIRA